MAFLSIVKREIKRITSRPLFFMGMVVIPIFMAFFFVSLLSDGLPCRVPAAIVDLDHSKMSRQMARSLSAMEMVDVTQMPLSYAEAIDAVQRGEIYGFFLIPDNFEKDAVSDRNPTLTFYSNLTYYVPGTMVFKGFKTLAVTTQGKIAATTLVESGMSQRSASTFLQPMTIDTHPIHNPWLNYSYYLSTSFIPGLLELMIFIMAVYAITHEVKTGSSRQWIEMADGNVVKALVAKLLPQTIIFSIIGIGVQSLLFGWLHFPMYGSIWWMMLSMILFVIASQSFAVIVCSVLPNMRLALSVCCLFGILAFSIAAFSFPEQAMYGALAIFSNLLPVRWYFLIYLNEALNGYSIYFSRFYFIALLIFPIIAVIVSPLMKRALKNPVYVP